MWDWTGAVPPESARQMRMPDKTPEKDGKVSLPCRLLFWGRLTGIAYPLPVASATPTIQPMVAKKYYQIDGGLVDFSFC